jgi:hypothetical protein
MLAAGAAYAERREGHALGSSGLLVALVVMIIGGHAGWHLRHAHGAHADLKMHKTRIPGFRRARARSGLISLALVVLTVLALRALMT